ncbi:hypothetical protein HMPREF3156_00787 [Neisseria sp. HMSC06F02]|nr:hypothetical protein HMPREF3156_00787 [Neisseria sp. HMSC06F02]
MILQGQTKRVESFGLVLGFAVAAIFKMQGIKIRRKDFLFRQGGRLKV